MHRQIAGKLASPVTKWIVAVIAIFIFFPMAWMGSKLTDVQDNEASSWLPGSAESTRALDELKPFQDPNDIPTIDIETRAEAFGACYVLEGSTLGGRMISRLVQRDGALSLGTGFLDPYGPETGPMWRSFLHVLEREAAGDVAFAAKAVSGAKKTFALAKTTLSKPTLSKAALSKAKVP